MSETRRELTKNPQRPQTKRCPPPSPPPRKDPEGRGCFPRIETTGRWLRLNFSICRLLVFPLSAGVPECKSNWWIAVNIRCKVSFETFVELMVWGMLVVCALRQVVCFGCPWSFCFFHDLLSITASREKVYHIFNWQLEICVQMWSSILRTEQGDRSSHVVRRAAAQDGSSQLAQLGK